MKRFLRTFVVFVVALAFSAVAETQQQFTVTGKLIPEGIYVSTDVGDRNVQLTKDFDWSTAKVVVASEIVNAEGETELSDLASGRFADGTINLVGEIAEPMDAQISVHAGENRLSTLDAFVSPGSTISFVLMENHAHLELLGASRMARDSQKKFTIAGDLSFMAGELEGAIVRVRAGEYTPTGERVSLVYGRVVPDDGRFLIEANVEEPRIVNVLIVSFGGALGQTRAIIEPGAQITISSQTDSLSDMVATSEEGKHAQLIDSWQQSEEYVSTNQAYRIARQEFADMKEAESAGSNTGVSDAAEEETPKYQKLSRELSRIQYDFLNNVATNAEDPVDALLALELGAYRRQEDGLLIYDRLIDSLDKDLVARRVIHRRNDHAMDIARTANDRSLSVGKRAPDFTLESFEGEEVSLSDLLVRNDYVLVDFWASWCSPCIATFPALKDLYASYREHGFEIVSVSIDDSHDLWSYSTEEYELPWINLGELEGFEGEMVMSYGVNFVPKGYLLDSEGHIVQKDLSTDQLKAFLASKYGGAAEQ